MSGGIAVRRAVPTPLRPALVAFALGGMMLLVPTHTALAQERPALAPSRDVRVDYKTTGREGGHAMRISYATSGLMRVDNNEMGGYALIDRAKQRATVVMTQMRMFMEMTAAQSPIGNSMPDKDAKFARKGSDTVAGTACTVWDVTTSHDTGQACIAEDGTMLRYRGRNGDGMEATKVTYGAIPAGDFAVPAGFQKMDMGAMGGGMPGMGGMGGQRPR